jgi:CrcB protein
LIIHTSQIVSIAVGGALGAVSRVYFSQWIQRLIPLTMPTGIIITNIIGCFLMGIMAGCCDRYQVSLPIKLLIISGGLGAFTTFSTFALETMVLVSSGKLALAILYVVGSVIGGIMLFWVGTVVV